MFRLFLFLIMFSITNIFAFEEAWKLGSHFILLNKDENLGLLISKNCNSTKCQAFNFLKKVSFKALDEKSLSGGKNPGAVLCDKNPEAQIIYLKDMHGNENSFCLFKDKSMVSSGSLYIYAQKNDERRK